MRETVERGIPQQFIQYYDLSVPDAPGPHPLLIAMHGYGGDKASMMRASRRIAGERFAIASLQGPHQHVVRPDDPTRPLGFGFGWVTNFRPEQSIALHHHAIQRIVEELATERVADVSEVFLMGFSQAVALNFRFAFTYPGCVRGVVAICGGIPGDWAEEGRYAPSGVEVLYVGGREDEYYPPDRVERNADAIRRLASSVEVRIYDVGHVIPREAGPDIGAWLRAHSAVVRDLDRGDGTHRRMRE